MSSASPSTELQETSVSLLLPLLIRPSHLHGPLFCRMILAFCYMLQAAAAKDLPEGVEQPQSHIVVNSMEDGDRGFCPHLPLPSSQRLCPDR